MRIIYLSPWLDGIDHSSGRLQAIRFNNLVDRAIEQGVQ